MKQPKEKIIAYLKTHKKATRSELSKATGINPSTLAAYMSVLKIMGVAESVPTYYKLKEK